MVVISYSQAKISTDYRHMIACVLWAIRKIEIPNTFTRYVDMIVPSDFYMAFMEVQYDKEVRKWTHFDIVGAQIRILLE